VSSPRVDALYTALRGGTGKCVKKGWVRFAQKTKTIRRNGSVISATPQGKRAGTSEKKKKRKGEPNTTAAPENSEQGDACPGWQAKNKSGNSSVDPEEKGAMGGGEGRKKKKKAEGKILQGPPTGVGGGR